VGKLIRAIGAVAAAVMLAGGTPPVVAVDSSPVNTSVATSDRGDLGHATEFRAELGFDASSETVVQAAQDGIGYPDLTWGIPLSIAEAAELQRRIKTMESVHPAVKAAEEDPTWAGWWIDQRDGGTPVLQFAADPEAKRALVEQRVPSGTKVRIVQVATPIRELRAKQDEIADAADSLRPDGVQITNISVNTVSNRVDVYLESVTDAAKAVIWSRFGDAIVIGQRGTATADLCPENACFPVKGGMGMTDQNSNWPCTVGYMAKRTDTTPDRLVFITAGHCVLFGTATGPWKHGITTIGTSLSFNGTNVHTWWQNSAADVGVVVVSSTQIPAVKNNILVNQSPVTVKPFEIQLSWDLQVPGMAVCRMGRTTGKQCGTIIDNDDTQLSVVDGQGSKTIQHVVVYGRDAKGGDSGGSIYYVSGTYAVLLGTHVHSQDGYVPSGGLAWYSPWDRGIYQIQSHFSGLTLQPCISSTCGGGF
jgi:hypothetical protein